MRVMHTRISGCCPGLLFAESRELPKGMLGNEEMSESGQQLLKGRFPILQR